MVEFQVVLRGYLRDDVDALVARANAAIGSADPALRATVRDELSTHRLGLGLRGYDRFQVDEHLKALAARLT